MKHSRSRSPSFHWLPIIAILTSILPYIDIGLERRVNGSQIVYLFLGCLGLISSIRFYKPKRYLVLAIIYCIYMLSKASIQNQSLISTGLYLLPIVLFFSLIAYASSLRVADKSSVIN